MRHHSGTWDLMYGTGGTDIRAEVFGLPGSDNLTSAPIHRGERWCNPIVLNILSWGRGWGLTGNGPVQRDRATGQRRLPTVAPALDPPSPHNWVQDKVVEWRLCFSFNYLRLKLYLWASRSITWRDHRIPSFVGPPPPPSLFGSGQQWWHQAVGAGGATRTCCQQCCQLCRSQAIRPTYEIGHSALCVQMSNFFCGQTFEHLSVQSVEFLTFESHS